MLSISHEERNSCKEGTFNFAKVVASSPHSHCPPRILAVNAILGPSSRQPPPLFSGFPLSRPDNKIMVMKTGNLAGSRQPTVRVKFW